VLAEQAAALAERSPDVVALQEVTPTSLPGWREALAAADLPHVVSSLDGAPAVREPPGPRRTGVLLASRAPLEALDAGIEVPWPETVLSALTDGVELHVCHVPNARNGWIKIETLEGIHAALSALSEGPRLPCGDFNTPRGERPDGTVITFARDRYPTRCEYLHDLRTERLSDHSALEADLG
jgi:endonuclease/exonuclease/phosphatase family metal-dependent hydrolase